MIKELNDDYHIIPAPPMEKFTTELYEIYVRSSGLQDVNALTKPFVHRLYETHKENADTYFLLREKHNVEIIKRSDEMVAFLADLFERNNIRTEIIPTSSIYAGTNLIFDSDSDISVLVDNCTESVGVISPILESAGFVFEKLVNPNEKRNAYYSFTQTIDNIEFEIKVRDRIDSKAIMGLHKHIEEKLTQTERIAITYAKYLFKKESKTSSETRAKMSYAIFKKLIYEMYFYYVDGGFMLELHYE